MLVAWFALTTLLALWPFDIVRPCIVCANGARIDAERERLTFPSEGLAKASVPASFLQSLVESRALAVEMWVTPSNTFQDGPARILSYSLATYERNFTIGQEEDALSVRLRTSAEDVNGTLEEIRIDDVFTAGQPTYILVVSDADGTSIAVDAAETSLARSEPVDFTSWSDTYDLLIGNEATGDRPWLGDVDRIVIRSGTGGRLLADFDFGRGAAGDEALLTKEDLTIPPRLPSELSLRDEDFGAQDVVRHLAMLFPVGFLFYAIFARRPIDWRGAVMSMGPVLGFATLIEFLQFFVRSHTTSFPDLVWGLAGGLTGVAAGMVHAARARR